MKMNRYLMDEDLKIDYERVNGNNYVVINTDEILSDNYQVKMIVKNRPEHFLKIKPEVVNNVGFLKYDISSKQQFSKLYEYEKITLDDVKSICIDISETAKHIDSYMLDLDYMLLDPEYIYMDLTTRKLQFIYLPTIKKVTFADGLRSIFDFILEHFNHSVDKSDIVMLYELYQKIINEEYDPYKLPELFISIYDRLVQKKGDVEVVETPVVTQMVSNIPTTPSTPPQQMVDVRSDNVCEAANSVRNELNGQEIKQLAKEEILLDNPESNTRQKNIPMIVTGLACFVVAGIKLLAPGVLPDVYNTKAALITLILGSVLILFGRRGTKKKKLEVKKEELPYVVRDRNNQESFAGFETVNTVAPAQSFNEQAIKDSSFVEHKEMDFEKEATDTVLLSDYLKQKNANNLKLYFLEDSAGCIENNDFSIIFKDENVGRYEVFENAYYITKNPVVFGNLKNVSDILINSKLVSRMHACVKLLDGEYYIEDLNSSNGTFVNDIQLQPNSKIKLSSGDVFRIATVSFKVEIS